jgi:hypothetical protein
LALNLRFSLVSVPELPLGAERAVDDELRLLPRPVGAVRLPALGALVRVHSALLAGHALVPFAACTQAELPCRWR